MSEDLVNGRPVSDMAALRELQAATDAFRAVPGVDHPARATALRLVSERVDLAVRRLRDVDGYPGSDQNADLATVRVEEVVEAGLSADQLFDESADGLHFRLELDVRVMDDHVGHGSPVDSSGDGTPGAEGASSDAPIVASEGGSGQGAVSSPVSGPLSPADIATIVQIITAAVA